MAPDLRAVAWLSAVLSALSAIAVAAELALRLLVAARSADVAAEMLASALDGMVEGVGGLTAPRARLVIVPEETVVDGVVVCSLAVLDIRSAP